MAGDDHSRELQTVAARVVELFRPSPALLRVVLDIGAAASDGTWARPNVAVRLNLGPEFDDVSRVYTVRDADLATAQITVDVVQHGAPGPMMRWSAAVQVGDELRLVGPRPHFLAPEGESATVLFADDSALPALYEILRAWPSGRRAVAYVASEDDVAVAELPRTVDVAVESVGVDVGSLLAAAVAVPAPSQHVVWAAGERDEMRSIRTHFRSNVGLGKDDVAVFGYWKRGVSTTDIDRVRLATYQDLLARGKGLADLDDLALDI
ncbi:putative siderophore-interacting protein [Gordonia soli NBRC 108243]|uniref:Putative siderophore-interacting protein n=1 Tax=Gordonia soli NBRC 108243 TaxID=1223545 RepID=M0QFF2_9ACTN|nr:putative siderophore-interacting protein [Gordonia soli NBRC 108243]